MDIGVFILIIFLIVVAGLKYFLKSLDSLDPNNLLRLSLQATLNVGLSLVDPAKAAAKDGKLSKEEKAEFKAKAMDQVINQLPLFARALVKKNIGMSKSIGFFIELAVPMYKSLKRGKGKVNIVEAFQVNFDYKKFGFSGVKGEVLNALLEYAEICILEKEEERVSAEMQDILDSLKLSIGKLEAEISEVIDDEVIDEI